MTSLKKNKDISKSNSPFEKRIHEIDLIRGFLIIIVVLDHICSNLRSYGSKWFLLSMETNQFFGALNHVFTFYWESSARGVIQPIALMLFCFISGVSCCFSKNNWKRAIETLVLWLVIALLTNIGQLLHIAPNSTMRIDFNIIGVLGFSMLFYCLIQKRSYKALIAAVLLCFLLSWYFIPNISRNFINYFGYSEVSHAGHTKVVPNFYFPIFWEPAYCFGKSYQADYVSLFPYIMFFFLGALCSFLVYGKNKKSLFNRYQWERPFCFVGRHTLLIYLTHILIITGIFELINVFIKMAY